MEPSYICFKEIDIDEDSSFTADFSRTKNEIEDVVFDYKYGVTSLTINSILPDEKIIKIENVKEQKRIGEEIQVLIKNYKESDLTFVISNPETSTIKIPFLKKKRNRFTKIKINVF